jgi:hypothetical protein
MQSSSASKDVYRQVDTCHISFLLPVTPRIPDMEAPKEIVLEYLKDFDYVTFEDIYWAYIRPLIQLCARCKRVFTWDCFPVIWYSNSYTPVGKPFGYRVMPRPFPYSEGAVLCEYLFPRIEVGIYSITCQDCHNLFKRAYNSNDHFSYVGVSSEEEGEEEEEPPKICRTSKYFPPQPLPLPKRRKICLELKNLEEIKFQL